MRVLIVYRDPADAQRYADALSLVGAEPVLAEARPGLKIGNCLGLLLTGGSDVNPALYREAIQPETDPPDIARDTAEGDLIDEALSTGTPIFAICRGMQILNAHLGGTLKQHLPTTAHHRQKTPDRGLPAHTVSIEPDTLLGRIAGQHEWRVNSRHHQAVGRLAPGLRVSAQDPYDGAIEAIEMPTHKFVLAVQWHPEDQAASDTEQRKLFQAFKDALKERA